MISRRGKSKRLEPGFDGKRELVVDTVASPYQKGIEEPVIRNVRESSISTMYARKQIDQAQMMAGQWFQSQYDAMRGSSMSVDPTYEPVDTSGHSDPIQDRVIMAGAQLAKARGILGIGFPIVEMVCGEGLSISEAARRKFGNASQRQEELLGMLFRFALDALAAWLGYAGTEKKSA